MSPGKFKLNKGIKRQGGCTEDLRMLVQYIDVLVWSPKCWFEIGVFWDNIGLNTCSLWYCRTVEIGVHWDACMEFRNPLAPHTVLTSHPKTSRKLWEELTQTGTQAQNHLTSAANFYHWHI